MARLRANVYVDGFNLYYRALKHNRCNWLNLSALAKQLLPAYDVAKIHYYTARIQPNPHDPGQHIRQQMYLRALTTLPDVEIHFGTFLSKEKEMPDALSWRQGIYRPVLVMKSEEKGSDVNLASHLIRDGFLNDYDVAAVVSNDTDLEEPIRIVAQELQKRVALLSPTKHPSGKLGQYADRRWGQIGKMKNSRGCDLSNHVPAWLAHEGSSWVVRVDVHTFGVPS